MSNNIDHIVDNIELQQQQRSSLKSELPEMLFHVLHVFLGLFVSFQDILFCIRMPASFCFNFVQHTPLIHRQSQNCRSTSRSSSSIFSLQRHSVSSAASLHSTIFVGAFAHPTFRFAFAGSCLFFDFPAKFSTSISRFLHLLSFDHVQHASHIASP